MAIPVELAEDSPLDFDELPMSLVFEAPLTEDQRARLGRLLMAWFCVGHYGLFGGNLLSITEIGYYEQWVEWGVDMSHADFDQAHDALLRCLESFEKYEKVRIIKLLLGTVLVD